MKLSTQLMYDGNPRDAADTVSSWEKAGLDVVWVAEAYGFDSPTLMGYLAAKTERIQIGSAILNIYSRTPGALLQTAAVLDNVSGGRAIIGLGHTLGLKVVAEGVEHVDEARMLAAAGCDELQGYLFSRPLAAEDFVVWKAANDRTLAQYTG